MVKPTRTVPSQRTQPEASSSSSPGAAGANSSGTKRGVPIKKKNIDLQTTTPLKFLLMFVMFVFKRFVFAPTHIKIGIYSLLLLFCSLIKDFNLAYHRTYLAQKSNIFNVYFVKFGWFWTMLVTIPFVTMTSIVYTGGTMSLVRKNLLRLLVATIIWYSSTSFFDYVDSRTGYCILSSFRTKIECKSNSYDWVNGFDISGHTFILMHSLFLMLEEAKVFNNWESLRKKIDEMVKKEAEDTDDQDQLTGYDRAQFWFHYLTPYIKFNFIVMALLALLWEVMLITTFLYFHTIMHKLIAACAAITAWFLTYQTWYLNKDYSPGMPGTGTDRLN
jgi:hypothetical protein